ncbi:MAG: transaldolase [Omnitrophica WOR_2 bacterium GWA2_47_8]|nr:MAG: transaldolase [Omnitrophica WOR_2 bacterium GWA2_47_8]
MSKTRLHELAEFGQSAWLDYIDRALIESGKLKKLIDQGLRGMTSNPSIFDQAISKSKDYDEKILHLKEKGRSTFEIYDELTVKDIKDACALFEPIFKETSRLDGYVSLEINPKLANDTQASIKEGKRLFEKVKYANCMIKVPATQAGYPVIEELIAHGINVNVTLIFSLDQYVETVKAYFKGLSRALDKKIDISQIRSVASVFVSRLDTSVDALLDEKVAQTTDASVKEQLQALKGKAAVANCRLIYEKFKELFSSKEFKDLFECKANSQRVLWGSTSTKNPEYSDIKYVTELIAKHTVNTIPEKTLLAFIDHGQVGAAFSEDAEGAQDIIEALKAEGIDIRKICLQLLQDGVVAFEKSFDSLIHSLETKAQQLCAK